MYTHTHINATKKTKTEKKKKKIEISLFFVVSPLRPDLIFFFNVTIKGSEEKEKVLLDECSQNVFKEARGATKIVHAAKRKKKVIYICIYIRV